MEAELTFGEYMRRLRRSRKWTLSLLAEKTGLNYPHLSRMENDSTLPKADTVARIAEALGGDLKTMLELADCLPRTILDRIMRTQDESTKESLGRTAGPRPDRTSDAENRRVKELLDQALLHGLSQEEAQSVIEAFEELVRLDQLQRSAVVNLIRSLSMGGDDGSD
jgi:transcriptional regulator with XRE-family HTH domain